MENNKFKLILGSASPRRKELLAYTYCSFEIKTSQIDEVSDEPSVEDWVMDIAYKKAKDVFETVKIETPHALVVGADTIVCLGDKILGKPKSVEHAREILLSLSGKEHFVLTGVSLVSGQKIKNFVVKTKVHFKNITPDFLEKYLETGEAMDKAGAYGIQAHALGFIGDIHGSYSNVVGLPLAELVDELKDYLGCPSDSTGDWRKFIE
jgi:septum formation protein